MSDGLGITVTGFEELKRKIEQLASDKDKKSEMLLILRQLARPTLNAARMLVPESGKSRILRGFRTESGNLKESIGFIKSKSANPVVLIGPRVSRTRGFNGFGNGWYGHFVHDGHDVYKKGAKRLRTKRGKLKNRLNVKFKTAANPFMDRAYESTKNSATADAERKMAKFIQRRIDRLS